MLAEVSLTDLPQHLSRFSPFLSPPLALLGLILMSHPSDHPKDAPWSRALQEFGTRVFPKQIDMARTWGSVGCIILILAILISPHARRLLSRPALLWLGRVSFPIYLLHGTFMRTLLAWFVFAGQKKRPFEVPGHDGKSTTVQRYPQPGDLRIILAITASMGVMLFASHWWAKKVEPVFGRMTKAAEELMVSKGDGSRSPGRPVLPVRKE